MTYQAPIRDIMFNIEHLSSWPEVTSMDTYSDVDQTDAQAALEGFDRFCSEVIAPLSAIGDKTGARFDGEKVVMPEPFDQVYAQLYCDARILPIYEGTTSIQANDLLGRKIMRDGGDVARRFSALIEETEVLLGNGGRKARIISQRLGEARSAFDTSFEWLLKTASYDTNSTFAGSVPFLIIAGNRAAGWQLARSVLVAAVQLKQGKDVEFMSKKIATTCFYAQHILVECVAERTRIIDGSSSLYDPDFQL